MPRRATRRLVIDASVAGRAGRLDQPHPDSHRCRAFLTEMHAGTHRLVMTEAIRREWDDHELPFARRWRAQMLQRGRIEFLQPKRDARLEAAIEATARGEAQREAIRKDLHLIAAARAADQMVVSLDEVIRNHFRRAAQQVGRIRNVVWVNPDRDAEACIDWLRRGAPAEQHRRLGYPVDE